MGRFTYRTEDGRWGVRGMNFDGIGEVMYGALCKLRDYENTGLSPWEVEDLQDQIKVGMMIGGYKVFGCCNGYCVAENKTAYMPYAVWQIVGDGHSICDGKHFKTKDEAGIYFTQMAWNWRHEE